MKIIKWILIILIGIVIVLTVIGFLSPSVVTIERSVQINKKPEVVFNYIAEVRNWNSWSPWYEKDTTAVYTYEGPPSGVGAMVKWQSNNSEVGSGSSTVTEFTPPSLIRQDLQFAREDDHAKNFYKVEPTDSGTKVTWGFEFDMGMNPFKRCLGLIMAKGMSSYFDQGLNKLKGITEALPDEPSGGVTVEESKVNETPYLAYRDTVSVFTIGEKLGKYYHEIGLVMKKQSLNMAGAPFAIFHTESETNWDMEAAVPVDKPGKAEGKVAPGTLKAGNVVVAHYFGNYMSLKKAYTALKDYMASHNKVKTGAPWEVYVTDPGTEKDTLKWQTDVYFPVQ